MQPPSPRGSSRDVGGFSRGRAQGNVANIADFEISATFGTVQSGFVYLYHSKEDPQPLPVSQMKATCFIRVEVHTQLAPILDLVCEKYAPIKSELLSYITWIKLIAIWLDDRIYIWDSEIEMWELKGLFDHAYAQSEAIDFVVENGRYCIHILAVRFYYCFKCYNHYWLMFFSFRLQLSLLLRLNHLPRPFPIPAVFHSLVVLPRAPTLLHHQLLLLLLLLLSFLLTNMNRL